MCATKGDCIDKLRLNERPSLIYVGIIYKTLVPHGYWVYIHIYRWLIIVTAACLCLCLGASHEIDFLWRRAEFTAARGAHNFLTQPNKSTNPNQWVVLVYFAPQSILEHGRLEREDAALLHLGRNTMSVFFDRIKDTAMMKNKNVWGRNLYIFFEWFDVRQSSMQMNFCFYIVYGWIFHFINHNSS